MNKSFRFPRAATAIVLACAAGAFAQWARTPVVRPVILSETPHDTGAFTQGLLLLDGKLYESTGIYGKSSLRELDPTTGKVLHGRKLPAKYFAEGLAWFNNEFVQLTWQEGEALRWPRPGGFSAGVSPKVFRYAGEGWGLATLGAALWMSNGSDTLYRRDASFKITARIAVRRDGKPVPRLNELEAAHGKILANIWYSDTIVVIDPRDGRVAAVIDGTGLVARSGRRSGDEVLNGIAWDPAHDVYYVTGKNWPKMFKVKIGF